MVLVEREGAAPFMPLIVHQTDRAPEVHASWGAQAAASACARGWEGGPGAAGGGGGGEQGAGRGAGGGVWAVSEQHRQVGMWALAMLLPLSLLLGFCIRSRTRVLG